MSSFKLEKKLRPAGKAWKSLAKKLNNISQALRKNLVKRIYAGHCFSRLQRGTNCSTSIAYSFASDPNIAEPTKLDRKSARETNTLVTIADAWEIVDSSSLHKVHSIDQKADEFITKFRENLKLQKERSDAEFEEMLARGAY